VGDGWTEQTEPASGRCGWPVGREIPEAERWALAAGLGAFCGEEVVIPAGVARRCEVHRPAAAVFPEWHRCYTPLALAPAAPKVKVAAKLVRTKAPKRARKAVA
jgi:hypothetical protein